MRNHLTILLFLTLFLFPGCEKAVPIQEASSTEDINGFHVTWRLGTTEEQRQIIRKIIEGMVFVEGGTFVMGATQEQIYFARKNEYPTHYVQLSDYYINRYELDPIDIKTLLGLEIRTSETSSLQMKNRLYYSWEDWEKLIKYINDLSGLEFDFPTEAQWEYAARGGLYGHGCVFPGSNNFPDIWNNEFAETDEERPLPNELGLYNLGDQLGEWCKDFYANYREASLVTNPCCGTGNVGHVVRGGCFDSYEYHSNYKRTNDLTFNNNRDYRSCRVSARCSHKYHSDKAGCRLVINIK